MNMGFIDKFFGRPKVAPRVALETQLQELEKLGISLNAGFTVDDLLVTWDRESLETTPYWLLYNALSGCPEDEEDNPFNNQIWGFDQESIIEAVDYTKLLFNIGRISSGELSFSNIIVDYQGHVDDPIAAVRFDLNREHFEWTLQHYAIWNSYAFLAPLNEFASRHALYGRLAWNRSWGDDQVLAWHTPELIAALQKLGVDIVEVTPNVIARKHRSARF